MRAAQRIPLFLSRVKIVELLLKLEADAKDIEKLLEIIQSDEFKDYWMNNQDLRFGQLLYNMGYLVFNKVYSYEEHEILNEYCGYSLPESHIWASNYNEDGSLRPDPVYRFIDELDDKHLATMVEEANVGRRYYNPAMVDIFCEELHRRGFVNYKLTDEGREQMKILRDKLNIKIFEELFINK